MSAREDAVGTIRSEHLSLETVVEALQRIIAEIAAGHAEANFALLSAGLYYFDDFPERCHHPKEDEFLFKALRRRTAVFNDVLDELQGEHIRSAQMMAYLHRALVHFQGGAPEGLRELQAGVDAYAALLAGHMRKEERLLASAQEHLREADWLEIAGAFKTNIDPLFGGSHSPDYGRLYSRIVTLLPTKLRKQMRREDEGSTG
ncbi:MAG: hemerythrin domain-containing protein [Betaproteobacteria bacterium]|nr:hemerythrin domain-containing protein [Betaproteobacteria bacterium]